MTHGDQAIIMPYHIAVYDAHAYTAMHCTRIKKSVDDNMGHHIIKMLSDQMVTHNMGSMHMAICIVCGQWHSSLYQLDCRDRVPLSNSLFRDIAKMANLIQHECPY